MLSTPGGLVGTPFELKLPVRAIIQLLSIAQLVEREIVVCYGSHASLQYSCGRWFESGWRDSGFALRRSDARRDVTPTTHKRFPQGTRYGSNGTAVATSKQGPNKAWAACETYQGNKDE